METENDPPKRPVLITTVVPVPPETACEEQILTWDEFFMSVALLCGGRSKHIATQLGACIVNEEKRIIGTGYNGMPDGFDFATAPGREGDSTRYECHAEMNAILNRFAADCKGCTMYTSLFPCNECAKMILQAGISEVVYLSDTKACNQAGVAAFEMFDHAKKKFEHEEPVGDKIVKRVKGKEMPVRRVEKFVGETSKVTCRAFKPNPARMMVHIDFDKNKV